MKTYWMNWLCTGCGWTEKVPPAAQDISVKLCGACGGNHLLTAVTTGNNKPVWEGRGALVVKTVELRRRTLKNKTLFTGKFRGQKV